MEEHTDLLTESIATTATANKAVVTSLNTVATWNEKERERLEDVIALAKSNATNFSLSEKIFLAVFLAAQASYDASHKIISNPQCIECRPGDGTDQSSDEYQQEILLLIDTPSDAEEKFTKVIDKRIMVNMRKLETTRLKLARFVSPACSGSRMEKDKYPPFPLAQFLECHTQPAWIAVTNQWIRKPAAAVLEKYLEIAHDNVFFTNAYDNNTGMYGKAGICMLNPVLWTEGQKLVDPIGYLRSQKSELLYDKIEALGTTYAKANSASKRGIKTGLDGKTSILPVKGDGVRRVHRILLSLGCTRSKDLREVKDELRLLHEKFTGDARLETAITQTKEKLESAALLGVVPQWEDVGKLQWNTTVTVPTSAQKLQQNLQTGNSHLGGAYKIALLLLSCSSQSLTNALLSQQGTTPFQKTTLRDPRASLWKQCKPRWRAGM